MMLWIYQQWCALWGHNYLVHRHPRGMWLRCLTCHHETPGVQIR